MLNNILNSFGLSPSKYKVQPFGSGLINHTFKVTGRDEDYILQQINSNIFKSPEHIAKNLASLQAYFKKKHPYYLFVGTLPTIAGDYFYRTADGEYYRLFPFIKGSQTINVITDKKEAFEAAKQFGKFTYMLKDYDASFLEYTLDDFHNLNLRFEQFLTAVENAEAKRLDLAAAEIKEAEKHQPILQIYDKLIAHKEIPLRVIHHDTKISNVLFDEHQNGLCVIDLDTVMPGYYLSDVGDMMRTYLSPANEEETDLSKVRIREGIFDAICRGYLSEMGTILTEKEKHHFIFSGEMMIYMQAIRFLTDFLNNDIYYEPKYAGHNLVRAKNQFKLLNEYINAENNFRQLIAKAQKEISTVPDNQ